MLYYTKNYDDIITITHKGNSARKIMRINEFSINFHNITYDSNLILSQLMGLKSVFLSIGRCKLLLHMPSSTAKIILLSTWARPQIFSICTCPFHYVTIAIIVYISINVTFNVKNCFILKTILLHHAIHLEANELNTNIEC